MDNSFGFDLHVLDLLGVGVNPPLVPLTPSQVFIDPHFFSLKKVKNALLIPLWFYHKSSTGVDWGHGCKYKLTLSNKKHC